jgi:hypothetical protein
VGKGNSRIKPSLQVKRAERDLFSKPYVALECFQSCAHRPDG